jgi:hypothetical protein
MFFKRGGQRRKVPCVLPIHGCLRRTNHVDYTVSTRAQLHARRGAMYRGVAYTFCTPYGCVVLRLTIRDEVGCDACVSVLG